MKKRLIILLVLMMTALLLVACGENKADEKDDGDKTSETTAVLETTADGGTVEQDAEGNIVTKGADGKVVYVEDKDGNPVDVNEYVTKYSTAGKSGVDDSIEIIVPTGADGSPIEDKIHEMVSTMTPENDVTEIPGLDL